MAELYKALSRISKVIDNYKKACSELGWILSEYDDNDLMLLKTLRIVDKVTLEQNYLIINYYTNALIKAGYKHEKIDMENTFTKEEGVVITIGLAGKCNTIGNEYLMGVSIQPSKEIKRDLKIILTELNEITKDN